MLLYCCLDLNWLELDLKLDLWNYYFKIYKIILVFVDWLRVCCKFFCKIRFWFFEGY